MNETDDASVETPDVVGVLQSRLKRMQLMVMIALGLAVLGLLLAGYVMSRQSATVGSIAGTRQLLVEQERMMGSIQEGIEAQLTEQEELRDALAERIESVARQVIDLDVNDPDNAIVGLQRILIRQERDYRDFLRDLEQGMLALHMMTPHSRGWWDDFQAGIEDNARLSEARENFIFNLRQ